MTQKTQKNKSPKKIVIIANYRIISKIGEGGMSKVYLAQHEILKRKVALKMLSSHLTKTPGFKERFLKEGLAQAQLKHPNIVQLTDCIEKGNKTFLVMDYIDGMALDEIIIKEGIIETSRAISIMKDILDAINYAHTRKVIHRDIKPSNIIIDKYGKASILDFGISIMMGEKRLTSAGTNIGTSCYMSPEHVINPKEIDHRSDVYAIGVVFYEMLTGKVPFDGDTDYVIKDKHVREIPVPPIEVNPSIPRALNNVIMKSMEKNPDNRFGGCGEFLEYIRAFESEHLENESHASANKHEEKSELQNISTDTQEPSIINDTVKTENNTITDKQIDLSDNINKETMQSFISLPKSTYFSFIWLFCSCMMSAIIYDSGSVSTVVVNSIICLLIIGLMAPIVSNEKINWIELIVYPAGLVLSFTLLSYCMYSEHYTLPFLITAFIFLIWKRKKELNGPSIALYWIIFTFALIGFFTGSYSLHHTTEGYRLTGVLICIFILISGAYLLFYRRDKNTGLDLSIYFGGFSIYVLLLILFTVEYNTGPLENNTQYIILLVYSFAAISICALLIYIRRNRLLGIEIAMYWFINSLFACCFYFSSQLFGGIFTSFLISVFHFLISFSIMTVFIVKRKQTLARNEKFVYWLGSQILLYLLINFWHNINYIPYNKIDIYISVIFWTWALVGLIMMIVGTIKKYKNRKGKNE